MDVLDLFSPATAAWFRESFGAPTPVQAEAWRAIAAGDHSLVIAPTGSGKTLAAFLWGIDRLLSRPPEIVPPTQRCRLLYISPLKALASDVERNLQYPLAGIQRLLLEPPRLSGRGRDPSEAGRDSRMEIAIRSGDTPAAERRRFARQGAEILITTPESLFLLLTSQARQVLRGVETVIIDEIHSLSGTKRGAHLGISLERLDAQLARPAQRIGLSATVRPASAVAEYLASNRPVTIVQPSASKDWQLQVSVPVADLADLSHAPDPVPAVITPGQPPNPAVAEATGRRAQASIWPHVSERLTELIAQHRSTIVFVNSRQVAERLATRINDLWELRGGLVADDAGEDKRTRPRPGSLSGDGSADNSGLGGGSPVAGDAGRGDDLGPGDGGPVVRVGQSPQPPVPVYMTEDYVPPERRRYDLPASYIGAANVAGSSAAVVMAHHGSMSHQQRHLIETALKAGELRAVVATSSLELGIDMGAVDLVIQVEAPPSVASGLQRIGRAGHQVGALSRGVFFPKYPGDLLAMTVVVERMRQGLIEPVADQLNPLDVLAQQLVAMVAMDDWEVAQAFDLVRRAAPFAQLTRRGFDSVLDMLSGRYPSEAFAELKPRLDWDRSRDKLTGRKGAGRLAVTNAGTIPDRGLYGVFLAGGDEAATGRRVGELDEEMVFESRVGDVITLGSSSWLITAITPHQVLVEPAGGVPGRLPFWKGDGLGRDAELGEAIGRFSRQLMTQLAGEAAGKTSSVGPVPRPGSAAGDGTLQTRPGSEAGDGTSLIPTGSEAEDSVVAGDGVVAAGVAVPGRRAGAAPSNLPGPAPGVDCGNHGLGVAASPSADLGAAPGKEMKAAEYLAGLGLDDWAISNLISYLEDQKLATGLIPDDQTIVIESFRDELGDWRVVILSPYGGRIHHPWSLLISRRLRQLWGVAAQVMATDDGIVLRLPDQADDRALSGLAAELIFDPDQITQLVGAVLEESVHFSARFREAAARALLLPRRAPGKRQPLWQLRHRAAQLLQAAAHYPEFPITAEAARECLHDDFDLTGLATLMGRLESGQVRLVEVTTERPSPFARTVLFNYVGAFVYDADTPLAELRAAALTIDPALLTELLGSGAGLDPADLLEPAVLSQVEAELQCLTDSRLAGDREDVHDLIRQLGPISLPELKRRCQPAVGEAVTDWLAELADSGQIITLADGRLASSDDAARIAAALWASEPSQASEPPPASEPSPASEPGRAPGTNSGPTPETPVDPLAWLVSRYALYHVPFSPAECLAWLEEDRTTVDAARLSVVLEQLVAEGKLIQGNLRPHDWQPAPSLRLQGELCPPRRGNGPSPAALIGPTIEPPALGTDRTALAAEYYCQPGVLAQLRRRSLSRLRAAVEPVEQTDYARFLADWHGIGGNEGSDQLLPVIEQLAGARLPASGLESFILPARLPDYQPWQLDELLAAGEVVWQGLGELAGGDGWLTLLPRDLAELLASPPANQPSPLGERILQALAAGGAYRLADLAARLNTSIPNFTPTTMPAMDSATPLRSAQNDGDKPANELARHPARSRRIQSSPIHPQDSASLQPGDGISHPDQLVSAAELREELWQLAWGGWISSDSLAPLRDHLRTARPAHRPRPNPGRAQSRRPRLGLRRPQAAYPGPVSNDAGRWFLLPGVSTSWSPSAGTVGDETATRLNLGQSVHDSAVAGHPAFPPSGRGSESRLAAEQAVARAEVLLDRYGVVSRAAVQAEAVTGGFAAVYRVLAAAEDQGRVRRGYFVQRLGGSQFALAADVDRLRAIAESPASGVVYILSASDPANPYGAVLPWPERAGITEPAVGAARPEDVPRTTLLNDTGLASYPGAETGTWPTGPMPPDQTVTAGHRPSRKAGALVALSDGRLLAYLERGGHSLLTWSDQWADITAAAQAWAELVHAGRLDHLTIAQIDSTPVLHAAHSPWAQGLGAQGFILGPQGLRLRR